uniref:Transmembrane protein n=1 Tax=Brassica oleracea var. oleracea TaxID=109376 RepID=A0A0D3CWM4_BRAOL
MSSPHRIIKKCVLHKRKERENKVYLKLQSHETWSRQKDIVKNHAPFSSTTKSMVVSPVKATSGVVMLFVILPSIILLNQTSFFFFGQTIMQKYSLCGRRP